MTQKKILVPGELVADKPLKIDGTFVEGGKTFASNIAVKQDDRVIPLKGRYLPKYGDYVVGIVKEERFSGYEVDINSPYEGSLSSRDLREDFDLGDVVLAQVIDVNEVHEPTLGQPRKLWGGEIIEVEPVKVPRVIGRNASMLAILKQFTGTEIFVGKNGRVFLKGGDAALATLAILKICKESHVSGLTDRITAFLEEEKNKNNKNSVNPVNPVHSVHGEVGELNG